VSFTIATSIDDAIAALAAGARPVAGGSDLVVGARHGKAPLPEHLVAIDRLTDLAVVTVDAEGAHIGALVSHHTIEHHPALSTTWAALADGSALVGSPSTRNVGTLGGNVMNGSPAMDTGSPLVVLGAEVELRSARGTRRISVGELWIGPGRTSAASDELCIAVHLPMPASRSNSAYLRLEYRRAMEIAVVGAGASVTLGTDGSVIGVRVALTAVAPTIIEVVGIEVVGMPSGSVAEVAAAAAALAAEQARPISDVRASDRYRRHTVGVMARRAVEAAARRAAGETVPVPVNRALGIGAAS
jgi:CO/xanthine dehydrogenase FAD-binding subunit